MEFDDGNGFPAHNRRMARTSVAGILLNLFLLCCCAAGAPAQPLLPPDVPINQDAGRGGWLIVTLQLESGQKLPVILDTGAGGTVLSKSLAPKLGKRLGTAIVSHWGRNSTNDVYAAPQLYLGGAPLLMTGDAVLSCDNKDLGVDGVPHLMGILGLDVLEHYCIQLDFAAGKMRFLDGQHADKSAWGRPHPIVALNDKDPRPAVAQNLLGMSGPHSIIDTGFLGDGWLMPKYFQAWTNNAASPANGELHRPVGMFDGEKYPLFDLGVEDVESDGIGIDFLARHLVTLDFPNHTLYLRSQSIGPLPNPKMAEYKPIPDKEPEVTAHVRAMMRDWLAGTEHADDYTASAWKLLQRNQNAMKTGMKPIGALVSLTLVDRRSSWFGWRRSYRYRAEFVRATLLTHVVFHGNKVAHGTTAEAVEWTAIPE